MRGWRGGVVFMCVLGLIHFTPHWQRFMEWSNAIPGVPNAPHSYISSKSNQDNLLPGNQLPGNRLNHILHGRHLSGRHDYQHEGYSELKQNQNIVNDKDYQAYQTPKLQSDLIENLKNVSNGVHKPTSDTDDNYSWDKHAKHASEDIKFIHDKRNDEYHHGLVHDLDKGKSNTEAKQSLNNDQPQDKADNDDGLKEHNRGDVQDIANNRHEIPKNHANVQERASNEHEIAIHQNDGVDPQAAVASKVLFLTYSRSGSSFLGEVINKNPDGFYYFEPLQGVYSALYAIPHGMKSMSVFQYRNGTDRWPPVFEADKIADQVSDLLSCNLQRLPAELFQDAFSMRFNKERKFSGYKACLRGKPRLVRPEAGSAETMPFAAAFACKNRVGKQCGYYFDDSREFRCFENTFGTSYPNKMAILNQNNYIHTKVETYENLKYLKPNTKAQNMLSAHNLCISAAQKKSDLCMDQLQQQCHQSNIRGAKVIRMRMENVALLLQKDPDIKIIHYFRDPRGLELSRSKGMSGNKQTSMIRDAEFTCRKMRQDIVARKKLELAYPNSFMVLKYEDLATDTVATAERIYSFMRMRIPPALRTWLETSTQGSGTNRAALSTAQRNGTATALRWRTAMPEHTAQAIAHACSDILEELGFEDY